MKGLHTMPRHYTDQEKRLVLDRLIANHGDVARTAAETGVSDRTLLRWRTENDIKPPSHSLMASPTTTTSPTQNKKRRLLAPSCNLNLGTYNYCAVLPKFLPTSTKSTRLMTPSPFKSAWVGAGGA